MNSPPAARPIQTSAEGPAPQPAREVWLRDYDGQHARRIPRITAERLLADGLADQVSAAGHLRLKLGIRMAADLEVHGIVAVEESRRIRGDRATARDLLRHDRGAGLHWELPAAK